MEIQKILTMIADCVEAGDVVGARRLLAGVDVDERDRKSIVAKER